MAATRPLEADVAGAGPAVVLLHGQPGRADNWTRAGALLVDRYRVIVPDRLGYGRTGGPAGDFKDNAEATVELLDRLGVGEAIVVGHSWAGAVAIEMAATAPARVSGLVLVASIAPVETVGRVDRLLAHRPLGDVAALASIGVAGMALSVPALRRAADRRLPAGVVHYMTQALNPAEGWRAFVAEQRVYVEQIGDLDAALAAVGVPTRVVVGTADRVVGADSGRILAKRIQGAVLDLISGAGHLLPWENPAAVAAAIDAVAG